MSNYNAIATEADFNGPEHTSWRGVQPARVVANIRVSTDFDLSKANFRKLNYYFNSEVCITVKKKESLEKKVAFSSRFLRKKIIIVACIVFCNACWETVKQRVKKRSSHSSFILFTEEENCMLYDPYLDSSSVCIRIPFVAQKLKSWIQF